MNQVSRALSLMEPLVKIQNPMTMINNRVLIIVAKKPSSRGRRISLNAPYKPRMDTDRTERPQRMVNHSNEL